MRKFFFIAVFFLAIIIVMFSFSELKNIVHTLKRHDLRFLSIAVGVQVLWMVNDAFEYRALYKLIGLKERFRQLFLLASAAAFVNVVAPSGGWGGTAVFIDNAGKRGHPRGHMAAATALYLFFDYTAFLFLLGWGILALFRRNRLNTGEITASILMVATVIGLGLLIYIGSKSAYQLGKILAWLGHQINRLLWPFLHHEYFHEERAILFGDEVAEGLAVARQNHQRLLLPMGHALINKILLVVIMALIFQEFHVEWTVSTIIASYAIGYLFLVISPTPSGIGIVEGILPLALSGLGIAWEDAIVITLTYRAVTFWIPLLLGGISFRILERQNS
jgi:glycosyltransferase 2 family protein